MILTRIDILNTVTRKHATPWIGDSPTAVFTTRKDTSNTIVRYSNYEEEEEEEINLLAWLPCRPRKHIYKPDGHNVITCNSKNATVLS